MIPLNQQLCSESDATIWSIALGVEIVVVMFLCVSKKSNFCLILISFFVLFQISPGDFPEIKGMQEKLVHHDFSKFKSQSYKNLFSSLSTLQIKKQERFSLLKIFNIV